MSTPASYLMSAGTLPPAVRSIAERGTRGLEIGALIALASLPLLHSLFAPFFADDYFHLEIASGFPKSLWRGWVLPIDTAGTWWTPPGLVVEYFRPLVVLSFALDRACYGAHPAGYHFTNLAMHIASTLLVWAIARHTLGPGLRAWSAAALFAIHPCHAQAIAWISGRTDVLASTLYAGAFLLYLQSRPLRPESSRRFALSMVFFSLALLAKEMAITLPALMLVDCWLTPSKERPLRRFAAPAIAGFVAASYVGLRTYFIGGIHAPPSPFAHSIGDAGFFRHVLTAPFLYLADFTLFVPPDPMVTEPFWHRHPAAFAALATLAVAALWDTARRVAERRALVWGLAWMAITLLPVAMLTVGEHFLYLPSMGYCILFGARWPALDARSRPMLAATVASVLAISAGRTWLFDRVADASSRVVDEAAAALDRAPQATDLLVAELPWAASLAFPHALRLSRPDRRVRAEILSIGADVFAGAAPSEVRFGASGRLELRRDGAFLGTYIERALAGPRPSFSSGQLFDRPSFTARIIDAPEGRLRAFEVDLKDPAHTLLLRGVGADIEEWTPDAGGPVRPTALAEPR